MNRPASGPALPLETRKDLGAYYTHPDVVRFLVGWGTDPATRSVMDPSCGDGRFLAAAGLLPNVRLVGCDVSDLALETTRTALTTVGASAELIRSDFFEVEPSAVEPVDLVVGNPPFIRYQRFTGRSRTKALESALRLGVRLTRLTSSWAPFVLHSMRFLRAGGCLAMVVPAEITQTQYGLRTLRAVLESFQSVRLLAFEKNFFEDAQVDTCLLMATGLGGESRHVQLVPISSIEHLRQHDAGFSEDDGVLVPLEPEAMSRFAEAYLPSEERQVWERIRGRRDVRSIASLARVTNGYVTGDNEFFHRTRAQAADLGFPTSWLWPTVRSSRSLRGLVWSRHDLESLEEQGIAHHLMGPEDDLFMATDRPALVRWLEEGESRGTPRRFKCRRRQPWWRVPGVQRADVLVGYMAGAYPRAAVNEAGAAYSNSLHGLRMRDGESPLKTALAFYSSLSLLSLEIEGRSYGGGILKLEPRELDRVLLPWPEVRTADLEELATKVDASLRQRRYADAVERVDEMFLGGEMGLSEDCITRLRSARERLLGRRTGRSHRNRKRQS